MTKSLRTQSKTASVFGTRRLFQMILIVAAYLLWSVAIVLPHSLRSLPAGFDEPGNAAWAIGSVLLNGVTVWLAAAPFAVFLPAVLWGANVYVATSVSAAAVVLCTFLSKGVGSGHPGLLMLAVSAVWLASVVRPNGRPAEDDALSFRIAGVAAMIAAATCFFVWLGHYPLRDFYRDFPFAAIGVFFAIASLFALPLCSKAVRTPYSICVACALVLLGSTHAHFVFNGNFESAAKPIVAGRTSDVPPVILIVVDTLRADSVSCLNPGAVQTRTIDALAAESIVFENAVSAVPWTFPAMNSMMNGVAPYLEFSAEEGFNYGTANLPTIATYLSEIGYETRGIVRNTLLRRPFNVVEGFRQLDVFTQFPFQHGTLFYRDLGTLPDRFLGVLTRTLTANALKWLDKRSDRPFFLWLHYFDPHEPYAPPAKFLAGDYSGRLTYDITKGALNAAQQGEVKYLYDAEIQYVDQEIGRVIARLKELGLYQDSLIILTSDHGEEFWEHGGQGHGHSMYQELLHVPLIVRLPGGGVSKRVKSYVPTQALLPTILDLIGIEEPPQPGWYASLAPLVREQGFDSYSYPILSSASFDRAFMRSVIVAGKKYIKNLSSGQEMVYDLGDDPRETSNVLANSPDFVVRAQAEVEKLELQSARIREEFLVDSQATSSELIDRLRNLGYIQ